MNRFAVVILNWNGAEDTIACIQSIHRSDPDAVPIIIDNGSSDNSISCIQGALEEEAGLVVGRVDDVFARAHDLFNASAVLVQGNENLGFAGGCNLGLKLAVAASFDVTIFLNNDTEVGAGALTQMVKRLRDTAEWFAVLPLIMIYGTDRIWNCGGSVSRLGYRRYNFAGMERSVVDVPSEISCSFFTGCCFAVRTSDFAKRSGFTERFFFGEEDFELSLWMKDQGHRALCLTDSVIQHKVGASISRAAGSVQASKVFVHYLNRFIHMRLRLGSIRWLLWVAAYVPYVAGLLAWHRIVHVFDLPKFFVTLLGKAMESDRVTRADFESIMGERPW